MKVLEGSDRKYVFEEWNLKFDSGDRFFHFVAKLGCFFPLILFSLACAWKAVQAFDGTLIGASLAYTVVGFAAAVLGFGGFLTARTVADKSEGGFRYTFARGRTPVIESLERRGGLKPHSPINLDSGSYLRYVKEKGVLGPSTSASTAYRRVLVVGSEESVVRLGGDNQQPLETCLLKLLNVSRVMKLPIRLEGISMRGGVQEESELSAKLRGLFSTFFRTESLFEYHLPPGSKSIASFRWTTMYVAILLGISYMLLPAQFTASKLTIVPSLFLTAVILLVWNLKDRFHTEHLLLSADGFVFKLNGKERLRRPITDLLEVRALSIPPEFEKEDSDYSVWLFFPDTIQPLFKDTPLSLADAQQVALSIRKVCREHALSMSDEEFGSHLLEE